MYLYAANVFVSVSIEHILHYIYTPYIRQPCLLCNAVNTFNTLKQQQQLPISALSHDSSCFRSTLGCVSQFDSHCVPATFFLRNFYEEIHRKKIKKIRKKQTPKNYQNQKRKRRAHIERAWHAWAC